MEVALKKDEPSLKSSKFPSFAREFAIVGLAAVTAVGSIGCTKKEKPSSDVTISKTEAEAFLAAKIQQEKIDNVNFVKSDPELCDLLKTIACIIATKPSHAPVTSEYEIRQYNQKFVLANTYALKQAGMVKGGFIPFVPFSHRKLSLTEDGTALIRELNKK